MFNIKFALDGLHIYIYIYIYMYVYIYIQFTHICEFYLSICIYLIHT